MIVLLLAWGSVPYSRRGGPSVWSSKQERVVAQTQRRGGCVWTSGPSRVGIVLRSLPRTFGAFMTSQMTSGADLTSGASSSLQAARSDLRIAVPDAHTRYDQHEEWFLVQRDGVWEEMRLHDYDRVFAIPGLYERVVYDIFGCRSPEVVCDLLGEQLRGAGIDPASVRALDLGAGNGYVADQVRRIGLRRIVGVDIEPAARVAAERDRPGMYEDYAIVDLTSPAAKDEPALASEPFDLLTCVAALGFGDIPPRAFATAVSFVRDGGLLAFTINSRFTRAADDESGFAKLLRGAQEQRVLCPIATRDYVHRVATNGEKIRYTAMIAEKVSDMPESLIESAER